MKVVCDSDDVLYGKSNIAHNKKERNFHFVDKSSFVLP